MKPRTLSATSLEVYRGCALRFLAENVDRRPRDPLAGPALFGVALHAAFDKYIERTHDEDGVILPEISGAPYGNVPELLSDIWEGAARYYLPYQDEYIAEGHELVKRWAFSRQNPAKVLSRELKETFEIEVPGMNGETQTVTYICDRIDQDPETGMVDIVDYKSQWERTDGDKMRSLFQPALYALAMKRKYGVDKVYVTFDMLRYEPVTVMFTDTQMTDFEDYLGSVARKIWDDDNPRETVNKDCRYCVRKNICKSFKQATELRWVPTMTVSEVAALRETAKDAMKGLEFTLKQADEFLLEEMRLQDSPVVVTDDHVVYGKQSKSTMYDAGVVHRVLGDDAIPFMKVQKTALDKELRRKAGRFTPAQRMEIEELSITTFGNTTVDVKAEEAS